MSRWMAFDYGKKRTGISVTDPERIIATGLTTIETKNLIEFIKRYLLTEKVVLFVLGRTLHLDGTENDLMKDIRAFEKELIRNFPDIKIDYEDERFTSKMAMKSLIESNVPKKKRRNKALLDEVSATLILQSYMRSNE